MTPKLDRLDHLVLTVSDMAATTRFYDEALGMTSEVFFPEDGSRRVALMFGRQKINLHAAGAEFEPKARKPVPGSADLCFLSATPLDDWQSHLRALNVPVEAGPLRRTGAAGPLISIYIRDPDGNLIELSNRL